MIYACPDSVSDLTQCLAIDIPMIKVDWSVSGISQQEIMLVFGGALLLWATGIGIGMLVSVIRRARL